MTTLTKVIIGVVLSILLSSCSFISGVNGNGNVTNETITLQSNFNKIDAVFNMPQGEPVFTKTNIRLRSLINNLKPNSNLILLSMYMLPENKIIRNEVIAKMIKKKIKLHLVFEKTIINKAKDFKKINETLKLNKFSQ